MSNGILLSIRLLHASYTGLDVVHICKVDEQLGVCESQMGIGS